MSEAKSWAKIGQILKSKAGNVYIKIEKGVALAEGQNLVLQKPADNIASLVSRGVITEAEGAEKLARLPDFVKFNILLPPGE